MAGGLDPPRSILTAEDLLDVLRRSVPREYVAAMEEGGEGGGQHESFAVFRALAAIWAGAVARMDRSTQARYYLPHALQRAIPATSAVKAAGQVTAARTGPTEFALVVGIGALTFESDGGREYVNAEEIVWNPGDLTSRAFPIECVVPGFVGNLDHLADADGNLVDASLLAIQDQDTGRAADGASILQIGGVTVLQDSGIPDLLTPEDVGLHVRIDVAADSGSIGQVRRIVGFDWPEQEIPVDSGLYPRRVFLDDAVRQNLVEAFQDDASSYTILTTETVTEDLDDVPLLPAVPAVADAFYFGHVDPMSGVEIEFDTPGDGSWTLAMEYWDGSTWVALPELDDDTDGLQPAEAGTRRVSWSIPSDWATRTSPAGTGLSLYYVRFRVATFTSVTVSPVAGRIVAFVPSPLVAESGTVHWTLLDYEDEEDAMALAVSDVVAPTGGRDDDLGLLGNERGLSRQDGETDDQFRDRCARLADVVSPNAILRAVNRLLAPFGLRGQVCDVTIGESNGAGFHGLFCDLPTSEAPDHVGAFDLYEPGDAYPEVPLMVLQDDLEAYGWFLVKLPYLGQGDFGLFCDDGPVYLDQVVNAYVGPALSGFLDGSAVLGEAVYRAIYDAVAKIKAGGVGFTMIRDESLTT